MVRVSVLVRQYLSFVRFKVLTIKIQDDCLNNVVRRGKHQVLIRLRLAWFLRIFRSKSLKY